MEFKREIFFRKKNTEDNTNKTLEDEFVFDIKNVDFYDDRTIKYIDNLKANDLGKYYYILEQLADLKVLNRQDEENESNDHTVIDLNQINKITENTRNNPRYPWQDRKDLQ